MKFGRRFYRRRRLNGNMQTNKETNVSRIKQRHRKSGVASNIEGSLSNEIETAPLVLF